MFVPCPHCGFLIALIVSRGGPAQFCPRCKKTLDGDLDEPATGTLPVAPASKPSRQVSDPSAATPASGTPSRPPRIRKHHSPSFVRIAAPARSAAGPRWPGRLAVAGLALALVVQLLLAQRHELAMNERTRPLISGVCTVLFCDLPPWREPAAYTMLARSVQPADDSGVLSVEASFRNDARWSQPWPTLLLSLSDVHGQAIAQRAFTAEEYRPGGTATATPLAPGQSASVQFEVVEPTPRIVAFTFEFR